MSASVKPIKLIADDQAAIAAELKSAYETATGRTVYPGQAEQLLIDICAYRESLCRAAINEAARQNLVAFARAPMLDYLGEKDAAKRLEAAVSKVILEGKNVTYDMKPHRDDPTAVGTKEMAEAIIRAMNG